MIVVEGKDAILGRLASFVAKRALQGDEVAVVNCKEVIITGNKKFIKENFAKKRSRIGHSQKGPKHPAVSEKVVKRAIRGMLPNYREGRGRIAYKKIKCYAGIPPELEGIETLEFVHKPKIKFSRVKQFVKK